MDEDSVVGDVVAAPIGTAVLDLLAHANGRGPELLHIGVPVWCCQYVCCIACDFSRHDILVAGENTTHDCGVVMFSIPCREEGGLSLVWKDV